MKLKKLDNHLSMCFFVGYKYGGGGYRVWDLKKHTVVEMHNIVFFKGGLPAPLLHEAPMPIMPTMPTVV